MAGYQAKNTAIDKRIEYENKKLKTAKELGPNDVKLIEDRIKGL